MAFSAYPSGKQSHLKRANCTAVDNRIVDLYCKGLGIGGMKLIYSLVKVDISEMIKTCMVNHVYQKPHILATWQMAVSGNARHSYNTTGVQVSKTMLTLVI